MADAVGPGARVTRFRRLPGGTATAIHAVNVQGARGAPHRMVLKRFIRADWLEREPDILHKEARALHLVAAAELPTPELVAADFDAERCDVPALLMRRLPGRVVLEPPDLGTWLAGLAAPLPAIHALGAEARRSVQAYRCYSEIGRLEPPSWSRRPELWKRALDLLAEPAPSAPERFVHRDYHPTNVLWSRGRLSAVLDWTNASHGPAAVDLGHCRLNLVQLLGVEVAERFRDEYIALVGGDGDLHPYWDLITAIEVLPEPDVYPGWSELGVEHLAREQVRERLDEYLARILARL